MSGTALAKDRIRQTELLSTASYNSVHHQYRGLTKAISGRTLLPDDLTIWNNNNTTKKKINLDCLSIVKSVRKTPASFKGPKNEGRQLVSTGKKKKKPRVQQLPGHQGHAGILVGQFWNSGPVRCHSLCWDGVVGTPCSSGEVLNLNSERAAPHSPLSGFWHKPTCGSCWVILGPGPEIIFYK